MIDVCVCVCVHVFLVTLFSMVVTQAPAEFQCDATISHAVQ